MKSYEFVDNIVWVELHINSPQELPSHLLLDLKGFSVSHRYEGETLVLLYPDDTEADMENIQLLCGELKSNFYLETTQE